MPVAGSGPETVTATRGQARRFMVRALWSIRWRVCWQVSLAVAERLAGLAGIVLLGVAVDRLNAGRTAEVVVIAAVIGVLAGVEAIAAAVHMKQAVLACCEVFVRSGGGWWWRRTNAVTRSTTGSVRETY